MSQREPYRSGRHFLQIPGPTNVPDRVLKALSRPIVDHRGSDFSNMTFRILNSLQEIFQTCGQVVLYPCSGTGSLESALVNTLSPGDGILMFETGYFALLWSKMARQLGLEVELVPGSWRHGVNALELESRLAQDKYHRIAAVGGVHNETSTGVTSDVGAVRRAIDKTGHPALLLVDAISSLGSIDYRHDEWGVDVTIAASQKGLMLPPGLGLNALSEKALKVAKNAKMPRSYWDWGPVLKANASGFFPYTPVSNLLFGLDEALNMLLEERLVNVFSRHARLAEATRRAVQAWGLECQALNPLEYSNTLTAIRLPDGHDSDELRRVILKHFDLSLGTGLGKVQKRLFRIGHLGDINELMLAGTLCGVEMGLQLAGVCHGRGGVQAALKFLTLSVSESTTGVV